MIDRVVGGDQAILVHPFVTAGSGEQMAEFRSLCLASGVTILGEVESRRPTPTANLLIGSGKAEETRALCDQYGADLVLVDAAMAPVQQRNLEQLIERRVLDRTTLILDIFAQRARSHEGKLQVELAQLQHLSTRLIRGWTHLERQKGGIGLRGPGETQLETDRRLLSVRVKQLHRRLAEIERRRLNNRRGRERAQVPQIALVGYTNAGKSTLFNELVVDQTFAADLLFATLDTTVRSIQAQLGEPAVLVDTVGFVRDLPHELVAAFKATLGEARDADLLLHVIDGSDPAHAEKAESVVRVLADIDADKIPRLDVINKVDQLDALSAGILSIGDDGLPTRVGVSAQSGEGVSALLTALKAHLGRTRRPIHVHLPFDHGATRASLYDMGAVLSEQTDDQGYALELLIEPERARALGLPVD